MAILTHQFTTQYERQRTRAQFEEILAERSFALEEEIVAVSEVLHSLRAFYDASDGFKRGQFTTFTREVLSRHHSIQAIEWAPRVRDAQRSAHEADGRDAGLHDYVITDCRCNREDRHATADMIPSPRRAEHFPVFFVEPLQGNESALGFDLGSEAIRRDALLRAMSTNRMAFTDPIVLVQEEGTSRGMLALLPVYERKEPRDVHGFVVVVFRIEDLVRQARRRPEGQPDRMRFVLRGNQTRGARPVLYASEPPGPDFGSEERASKAEIRAGDEAWLLVAEPTGAFLSERLTRLPLVGAFVVLLLVAALGSFVFTLANRARELALRRQDRTIRAVLGGLVEGVVVVDTNGRVLLANAAAERAVRMGADEARPGCWSAAYGCHLPDMETPFPEHELPLARALKGETVTDQDIFVRHADAQDGVWIRASAAPLADETGDRVGAVLTLRDTTARVQSEQLLSRLSSAVEQTADAIFITDRDGTFLYVNPAFEAITGYASAEVVGSTPRILNSGEHDREHFRELWSTVLRGETFRSTTINRKKNGELYYSEQTITPMKDAAGRVTHFVAVCKDMTERRRIEEQATEMRLAAVVQRHLYPKSPPDVPGIDLAGVVYPAEATCGDYFDFFRMGSDRIGVVIGDVSGHGLGPAMVMAQTRAYLHAFVQRDPNPAEILTRVNEALVSDLRRGFFVTMLLMVIDLPARRLVYASAGHSPCYVLDPRGEVKEELILTGIPLGIEVESTYGPPKEVDFGRGDLALLITDGVTECRSPKGEFFGEERVLEIVKARRHERARDILGHIHEAVGAFRATPKQSDDITMVACKFEPVHADGVMETVQMKPQTNAAAPGPSTGRS